MNLQICFPELSPNDRERMARQSLQHTGSLLTETGMLFHWPEHRWKKLIAATEGEHLLQTAADDARGVLLLVPHLGNWEFLSLYLGQYHVTALYAPPRIAALEPLIARARTRAGSTLFPIDARGLRAFYLALKKKGVVALLPDQVPDPESGVYADFFGRPVLTMTFAHRLITRENPQVLIGAATRCPGGFKLSFVEADAAIRDPDPEVSASAMNKAIEKMVRTAPDQYQWQYKRFKRPPPGLDDVYKSR